MPSLNTYLKLVKKLRHTAHHIAGEHGTPVYIFDRNECRQNVHDLKAVFKKNDLNLNIFYATKSNSYIGLLKTVVASGEGIDVSSRRELKLALKAGAKKIIYTGPAKTEEDFELILKYPKKITVNLETFRELRLLSEMAAKKKVKIQCGLRIYTKSQLGWTKFGLPLNELKRFFAEARTMENLNFCGIYFHISFNKNPDKFVETLKEVGNYLKKNFSYEELLKFEYIDIGGGIVPESFDGIYPWNKGQLIYAQDTTEVIAKVLKNEYMPRFEQTKTTPLEVFAKAIANSFKQDILSIAPNAKLYAEPGRFICHSVMHFLLKIIDLKTPKTAIVNGGINMIGWEKFQYINYAPIFNLAQFTVKREIPFITYGSLCTPDDIWGYYLYTKGQPCEGDILLMPYQGAYTYTLAQKFIKDIPKVVEI